MDDDVLDVEAVRFAAGQVVVAPVGGIRGIILVIGGRDESAGEASRAISRSMLAVEQVQRTGGAPIRLDVLGRQRHPLPIRRRA